MDYQQTLLDDSRNKFMKLANYLENELKKLYDDGVLTKIDWMKLVEDSQISGQAVIRAIDRTDYPPEMQGELVKNLIAQYEVSIEQTLQGARHRRYAPDRIEERLKSSERLVLENWENAFRRKTINRRQYQDILKRVKTSHRDIVSGIRSIPLAHPKKIEMIESWLDEYQQQMEKLAILPAARLSYASSNEVSSEYSKHPKPPVMSQYAQSETREETRSSVYVSSPFRRERGIIQRIRSAFKKNRRSK